MLESVQYSDFSVQLLRRWEAPSKDNANTTALNTQLIKTIDDIRKFGYDEFCAKVIEKALALYPNSINANMVKSNIDTNRFETVMFKLKINPRDKNQLQNIRYYPKAIELLKEVNQQYDAIDYLGYEHMPEDAYMQWLQSMHDEKNKQDSEKLAKQFKGTLIKPLKN